MSARRGVEALPPGIVEGELDLPTLERWLFADSLSDVVSRLQYYHRLEEVWRMIEGRYWDASLSLDHACHRGRISRAHLNHLLRRTTSFSFHSLLSRYRVRQSIDMIWKRNYSLSYVASHNGFGSLSGFQRNFRKLVGWRPVDYRRARVGLLQN